MEEGQAFPEFVLLCARAMGATIMMRDEPLDAPIPEFEPSDYSSKRLAEARAELDRLIAMTGDERLAFGQKKRDEAIERAKRYLEKDATENARLIEMRDQVSAWHPPTPDHVGLKEFMLDQINISMNRTDYWESEITTAEGSDPGEYYDNSVTRANRDIEYHTKGDREERERTAARNKWVKELVASVKS